MNLPKGIYRLEYNEDQRMFHFDSGNHEENSFGWVTLKTTTDELATEFTSFMDKKYVEGRVTGILPELKVVKLELDLFFELRKSQRKLANRI